jgi:hypothetical protein
MIWRNLAIALVVVGAWFVSVNAAFNLGIDTSLCVSTHLETAEPASEIEACQRASSVGDFPVKQIRQSWLWLVDDEVK